jgi:hypothetical protein
VNHEHEHSKGEKDEQNALADVRDQERCAKIIEH